MKSCRKVAYPSEKAAFSAKWKINKRGKGRLLTAYVCPQCHRWHLGNTYATRVINLDRIFDKLPASDRASIELAYQRGK